MHGYLIKMYDIWITYKCSELNKLPNSSLVLYIINNIILVDI